MSVDPPPRVSASSSSLESSDRPTEGGGISVEPQSLAEARLAGIVSISADAIISIDASHRISLFNLGAQKIFGYTEAEMLGQPLELLLPEGARGRHQEHINDFGSSSVDARRMGERSVIAGRRKNGETFPAEASISKIDVAGERVYTVILRDGSERKRSEDALLLLAAAGKVLSSSLELGATLESVTRLVVPAVADCCVIDASCEEGAVVYRVASANAGWQETLIRDDWTLLHDCLAQLRDTPAVPHDVPPLLAPLVSDAWLTTCDVSEAQRALVKTLGIRSLMSVPLICRGQATGLMTFLMTDSGRTLDVGASALAREVAVRVAQAIENGELYRRSREAVEARDEVLAIVSHDLRNPLSVVSMCASSLGEAPLPDDATIIDLAHTMQQSAEWMQVIIQDLLDVARLESGRLVMHPTTESVVALMERAIALHRPLAEERGLALSAQAAPNLPAASVDAARVSQVLANLIGNSLKFTAPGGSIRVEAMASDFGVTVSVTDSGCGISADHFPHLFDRFWQVRRDDGTRSTGLGLAIAKGIVEAHGGVIWAESTVDVGTTFFVTLPRAKAPSA